ncbi:hypothetical protein COO60DRAFT_1692475 [Scenedesmus sp. NREL 46B-D3]|nr:hypothetical protein COO60DRAFT_1692475 [Scenedesmus sp. NREL 46B-D3]
MDPTNAPYEDPKAKTQEYLEQHKLGELMEGLLAELMYNKPPNPRQYIVMQLEKIKAAGTKPLLNKQDLDTMFCMFDVTNRGAVTEQQARNALRTVLGSRAPAAAADASADSSPLGREDFVQLMDAVLLVLSLESLSELLAAQCFLCAGSEPLSVREPWNNQAAFAATAERDSC